MRASHSEITTYADCRVKHHFKYRLKLPVFGRSLRLEKGSAVHAGLEHTAKTWCSIEEAKAVSEKHLKQMIIELTDDDISAVRAATRAGYKFLQQVDLGAEHGGILAAELPFEMEIDGWEVPGVIDLVFADSYGNHHILDWKTSDSLPSSTVGMLDPQTAIYALYWMTVNNLTWMYAGRCYLRLESPEIKITKGGRVSEQSMCSLSDYKEWITQHPETAGTIVEQERAAVKFGPWWRHHEDMVSLDYCRGVVAEWRAVAHEIDQNLPPWANLRPKSVMCANCEYLGPCTDRILNQNVDLSQSSIVVRPSRSR